MAQTTQTESLPSHEEVVYRRPAALTETQMRYCPGCTHGTAHRLIAEVLDELELTDRTVAIATALVNSPNTTERGVTAPMAFSRAASIPRCGVFSAAMTGAPHSL